MTGLSSCPLSIWCKYYTIINSVCNPPPPPPSFSRTKDNFTGGTLLIDFSIVCLPRWRRVGVTKYRVRSARTLYSHIVPPLFSLALGRFAVAVFKGYKYISIIIKGIAEHILDYFIIYIYTGVGSGGGGGARGACAPPHTFLNGGGGQ